MPSFLAGQKLTAALLNLIGAYALFWANPPMFRMYQTVAQTLTTGAFTQILCDTSDYDTDSGRSDSSPYSYTIPVGMSGRWKFTGAVSYASSGTANRLAAIYRNGTQITGLNEQVQASSNGLTVASASYAEVSVNAGDVIALYGYQGSGGNLATAVSSGWNSYFEGRLVSLANP